VSHGFCPLKKFSFFYDFPGYLCVVVLKQDSGMLKSEYRISKMDCPSEENMGLVAYSLDMLADASVCGLSLRGVGSTVATKKSVARYSGVIQFVLTGRGIFEVIINGGAIRMIQLGK